MALTTGKKLGPYEIQNPIGAGGMGEVYRAHDSRLNRTVAIKILPAAFSAERERLARFAQEARAAAALNHPNILSIYDIGEDDVSPYIVSELLEGETLRERLRTGPLPMRKAIDYALQIARGLAAAHEKGIVHRDLKPENLFLTEDGRVKILDFGLAKLTRPESLGADAEMATIQEATDVGTVMGTVGYMSPEQVRGKPADARSDIFAFGAILFEMISGKRAFHGETAADTMSAILKEEVEDLSETNRNVAPGLERIVRHCLEKSPVQRFHSANDLAFDLEALTDLSSSAKSAARGVVARDEAQSRRTRNVMIAASLVAAFALLGVGWWLGHGSGTSDPAEYKQITFRTGGIGNARFTPDGSVIYSATFEGGQNQLYMATMNENGAREVGVKDAEILSISKNGELAIRLKTQFLPGYARSGTLARVPLSGGTPREMLDNVQDADWAADGEKMAVIRNVPENGHWKLEYPVGTVLLDGVDWISHPKISPDGKMVAFLDHESPGGDDQGTVAVIGPDGKEKKLAGGYVSVEGLVWAPNGKELWYTATRKGNAENLRGVTLSGKEREITNVPGGMWLQDIRNGDVLTIAHQIRIGIKGTAPGKTEEKELGWLGWGIARDISWDGTKIIFEEEGDGGGPDYTVFLRNTDGSPPVKIGQGLGLAISPDMKWVITKPNKTGSLFLVPTGAGEMRQLTHDQVKYDAARYLPDGKHIVAIGIEKGHGVRDYLVDVSSGSSKPLTTEGTVGLRLTPDGRSLVVRDPQGQTGTWSIEGGTFSAIAGLDPKYAVMGYSADGAALMVFDRSSTERSANMYRFDLATRKVTFWKAFGNPINSNGPPNFSRDGRAYYYVYNQLQSVGYVASGIK
jgi:tRNA A-37 threonylcarbamoyl transferase component Bud32/Tol biopolymer transport system component